MYILHTILYNILFVLFFNAEIFRKEIKFLKLLVEKVAKSLSGIKSVYIFKVSLLNIIFLNPK